MPAPIDQLKAGGFSDDEIGQWSQQQRQTLGEAGFGDDEIDRYLGGPRPSTDGFLKRAARSAVLLSGGDPEAAAAAGASAAMRPATQPFVDLARDLTHTLVIDPIVGAYDTMEQTLAGKGFTPEDALNAAVFAVRGAPITRIKPNAAGGVDALPIGNLPENGDFGDAAHVTLGVPHPGVEAKVKALWEEHGIHPGEVAHDAATDPTIAQDLASADPGLPKAYVRPGQQPRVEAAAEPATPAAEPATSSQARPEAGAAQPQIQSFSPADLRVDPERFQFKANTDQSGVSERLRGVSQWDPIKAGLGLVWQDEAGANWVADGHQRVGLAKRIADSDPAQDPRLNAWVLKAADGVTDADARAVAAAKNIAEGTGSPIDAAKVLRDRPDLLPSLPPRSEVVRQARGLVNLDGQAFGKVANEVVPANYAAIVGRLVPEDAKLQNALIDLLAKTEPQNAVEAESIVRQGMEAGTRSETQATLFGDEEVASSLYLERARILDRSLKTLRRDRTVFQSLIDNSAIIKQLGNELAQDENARRAVIDGQAVQILQTLANRRGAIGDALGAAAKSYGAGDTDLAAATRDFVAELRRQAQSGNLARLADGGGRGPVAAEGQGLEPARGGTAGSGERIVAEEDPSPRDVAPAQEARAAAVTQAAAVPRYTLLMRGKGESPVEPGVEVRNYEIRNDRGGVADARVSIRGSVADIDDIRNPGGENLLGAAAMRQIARQFFAENPEIDELQGLRVSGARLLEGQGPEGLTVTRDQAMGRRAAPKAEQTDQGTQLVIPGAERSAVQAAASREAEGHGKITPSAAQQEPGGLFAAPEEPPQPGLFGRLASEESGAVPLGGAPATARTPAEEAVLSRISVGETNDRRPWSWGRLYTAVVDKLYPISEATTRATGGAEIPTSENPYQLARLLSGVAGKADHFLNHGTVDWHTYEVNGEGLKQILDPIKEDLDGIRAFASSVRALELGNRGIETGIDIRAARQVAADGLDKYGETLARLIAYQDRVTRYLKDSGVLSEEGYAQMREANRLYVPFNRVMGDETPRGKGGASLQASNPIHRIKGSAREIIDPIESMIRNTFSYVAMAEKNAVGTALVDMLREAGDAHGAIRDVSTEHLSDAIANPSAHLADIPIVDVDGSVLRPAPKQPDFFPERGPIPREAEPAATPGPAGIPDEMRDAIHEALQAHGLSDELFDFMTQAAAPGEGEIAIFRNGRREVWAVDPDIARAVKGLDRASVGMFERILAKPASWLRAGAVLNPDFQLRHTFRDYLYAAVTSPGVFSPADMARGFMGLISKDADYWKWEQSGGSSISRVALDRRYLQESLRELNGQTGLMVRAWNVIADPDALYATKAKEVAALPFRAADKYILDPLRMVTELAENASHLGGFKKSLRTTEAAGEPIGKEQIQQAGFASRDLAVDASRIGASTRAYNMITAFANITIQDSDRVARAFIANPTATALKIGAGIMLPSALLWYVNHDDPDYAEIPQWEKDLFWIFPVGSTDPSPLQIKQAQERGEEPKPSAKFFMRLPKPWGMGVVFGSGTERSLQAYFTDKGLNAFEEYGKSISDVMVPQMWPTGGAPILDQFANRSTFTNRTLVPAQLEKQLPEYQYTPYTTEVAKKLASTIAAFPGMRNLSLDPNSPLAGGVARTLSNPILLENYLRAWTGNLGVTALDAADYALRKAGLAPDPVKPADTVADIPVVKAFAVRYPSASAESIQKFYDDFERNKRFFDSWNAKAQEGDALAMAHIQEAGGPRMFVQLDGIKQALGEHSKLIRDIWKNPEIGSDEKRQLIDTLYFSQIQIAQAGRQQMKAIDQALATMPAGATLH